MISAQFTKTGPETSRDFEPLTFALKVTEVPAERVVFAASVNAPLYFCVAAVVIVEVVFIFTA